MANRKLVQLSRRLKAAQARYRSLEKRAGAIESKRQQVQERASRAINLLYGKRVTAARKKSLEATFVQANREVERLKKLEDKIYEQLKPLEEKISVLKDNMRKVKAGKKLNPRYLITATRKRIEKDVDLGVLQDDTAKKALSRAKGIYKGKSYTNMKARKRNPSPAQIRARKAFARMAKERSRAAKARRRNSTATQTLKKAGKALKSTARGILNTGAHVLSAGAKALNPKRRNENYNIYVVIGKTQHFLAVVAATSAAKAKQQAKSVIWQKYPQGLPAGAKIKIVPVTGQTMANPTKRIKVRNSYIDLVIRGTAKKTRDGWKVGRKTVPQGRGTAKLSSGYYLDKATGAVYAKRTRNAAMFRDEIGQLHPIRSGTEQRTTKSGTRRLKSKKPYKPSAVGEKYAYSPKKSAKRRAQSKRLKTKVASRRTTTSRLAGRSLRKSSGMLKRRRNVEQGYYDASGFHAIRASGDYVEGQKGSRSKRVKARTAKAASTWKRRHSVKSRKATTSRFAGRSLKKSSGLLKRRRNASSQSNLKERVRSRIEQAERTQLPAARELLRLSQAKLARLRKAKAARWEIQQELGHIDRYRRDLKELITEINDMKRSLRKANPTARSIRKKFAGRVGSGRDLFFPQGTPQGLAKLGRLTLIKTKRGTIKPSRRNPAGEVWLCSDTNGRLHLGTTSNAPLFNGPAQSFGEVTRLEYDESKPHLGYGPTIWFHNMGEESGKRPTLYADGKGGLKFRGGAYKIKREGIIN